MHCAACDALCAPLIDEECKGMHWKERELGKRVVCPPSNECMYAQRYNGYKMVLLGAAGCGTRPNLRHPSSKG